jgi:hypothetical protein
LQHVSAGSVAIHLHVWEDGASQKIEPFADGEVDVDPREPLPLLAWGICAQNEGSQEARFDKVLLGSKLACLQSFLMDELVDLDERVVRRMYML